jgi:hypothetical protein
VVSTPVDFLYSVPFYPHTCRGNRHHLQAWHTPARSYTERSHFHFSVKLLRLPTGRCHSWWSHCIFFNLPNPSGCTMALGFSQPPTKMSTRNLHRGNGRLTHNNDNLTAICKPII